MNEAEPPVRLNLGQKMEKQQEQSQGETTSKWRCTMKIKIFLSGIFLTATHALAQNGEHPMPKEMQHGFVLSADDTFASHLVARGHHSRQTEITGQLIIEDDQEIILYKERKKQNSGGSYFLLQAQYLDLPNLSNAQILRGHIIESKIGGYEPENKIVKSAIFKVQNVILNIPNPFFDESGKLSQFNFQEVSKSHGPLDLLPSPERPSLVHCCDSGVKPCNWKC